MIINSLKELIRFSQGACRKSFSRINNKQAFTSMVFLFVLAACEEQQDFMVGQLESDRVEIVVDYGEAITKIAVTEGDELTVDDLLLEQDYERVALQVEEANANILAIEARLSEQLNGTRIETVEAMEANLKEAEIEKRFRTREVERLQGLREQNLTSIENLDNAEKALESSAARIEFTQARLSELQAGTRSEQILQTRANLQQAQVQQQRLELELNRHRIHSPVRGIVDSLPFEVGEKPRPGDVIAVLLTGAQPYARIYVPEALRVGLRVGSNLALKIDGIETMLTGTIRRISNEPAFTPYFALTERDRGRLSFIVEVTLPHSDSRFPEGMPVEAYLPGQDI